MQARLMENTKNGTVPVFSTDDAANLWELYLGALPEDQRQYHTCHCCRRFIEAYGGLVTIDLTGSTTPLFWHVGDAPERYAPAVSAMAAAVMKARVTGVFHSSEQEYGQHETGIWRHFALTPPALMVFKATTQSAGQKMAERREDFKTVRTALGEFSLEAVEAALRLLRSDVVYRSEVALGQAEWLHQLHTARDMFNGPGTRNHNTRNNVTWLAIATAPAGFCHPRTSMIGTLLEDIISKMDFETIAARWKAKMAPLQFQRPQAPPTAGAIAAAEKLVDQLGASGALHRRFCRLDEVEALWKPAEAVEPKAVAGKVFGHIRPKGEQSTVGNGLKLPMQTMTWDKFSRTVLPTADSLELYTSSGRAGFGALTTAVHADAVPILQWDSPENRNPVSWYMWAEGSHPREFSLPAATYVTVQAITAMPCHWKGNKHPHHGEGVFFILMGAMELGVAGNALFPSHLKSEFHGIRSVIEEYAKTAPLEGRDQPHAAGLFVRPAAGASIDVRLRVKTGAHTNEYRIDRWD